jgi:very-short-patch-repair endonuclease
VIFVEGPDHDEPEVVAEDYSVTEGLSERGYTVVRFNYRDDWDAIFAQHCDIFGLIRS